MTLYEALSLLVSAVGTLATVYIGLRQLRPAPSVPAPSVPVPYPPGGMAPPWMPTHPVPAPRRPTLVSAASLLLYVAATTQPVVFAIYYGIQFASDAAAASQELGNEGFIDVLGLGGIALGSALLGIFVGRGSRVARALVWSLGVVSVLLFLLLGVGILRLLVDPQGVSFGGLDYLFFGYLYLVLAAYMSGAGVLLPPAARAYFRR